MVFFERLFALVKLHYANKYKSQWGEIFFLIKIPFFTQNQKSGGR